MLEPIFLMMLLFLAFHFIEGDKSDSEEVGKKFATDILFFTETIEMGTCLNTKECRDTIKKACNMTDAEQEQCIRNVNNCLEWKGVWDAEKKECLL